MRCGSFQTDNLPDALFCTECEAVERKGVAEGH